MLLQQALASARILAKDIKAIGLTNQKRKRLSYGINTQDNRLHQPLSGKTVSRISGWCNQLLQQNLKDKIQSNWTSIDPLVVQENWSGYFEHVNGLRRLAEQGHVAFGTIDSWLIWNLTQGAQHVIEVSNASRTMLMNLNTQQWDEELLDF